jgi:hypothetical protein
MIATEWRYLTRSGHTQRIGQRIPRGRKSLNNINTNQARSCTSGERSFSAMTVVTTARRVSECGRPAWPPLYMTIWHFMNVSAQIVDMRGRVLSAPYAPISRQPEEAAGFLL